MRKETGVLSLVLGALAAAAPTAQADIVNGGFEELPVFTGWNIDVNGKYNEVSVQQQVVPITPTGGSNFAYLNTSVSDIPATDGEIADWLGVFKDKVTGSTYFDALAAGISPGATAINGSVIAQDFSNTIPDNQVLFDYFFATNEPRFFDFAVALLIDRNGPPDLFPDDYIVLGNARSTTTACVPDTNFAFCGDWLSSSLDVGVGDYTLAFAVFNEGSRNTDNSAVAIDQVELAKTNGTAPAPATLALLGIGLAGMGLVRRRKTAS
jgi:hypothetical protein